MIFAVLFGFLELGARIFWERPPQTVGAAFIDSGVFRADADCGWRMNSDVVFVHELQDNPRSTIHTNSRGLRSPEHLPDNPNRKRRILVLGDSFAFGWGVDDHETFPAQLQARMPDAEVINLGVSGYNLAQSHRLLVAEGLRYEPDLVILSFCHNDVTDQKIPTIEDKRRAATPVARSGWKAALCDTSYLVDFLRFSATMIYPVRRTLQAIGLKEPDGGYGYLDTNLRPSLRGYPPSLVSGWDSTVDELGAIYRTCTGIGAKLLVATIPPRQLSIPGNLRESLAYVSYEPTDFDSSRLATDLSVICERVGITFVDTSESLSAPDARNYLRFDMHLSPQGNVEVAKVLVPKLEQILQQQRQR